VAQSIIQTDSSMSMAMIDKAERVLVNMGEEGDNGDDLSIATNNKDLEEGGTAAAQFVADRVAGNYIVHA